MAASLSGTLRRFPWPGLLFAAGLTTSPAAQTWTWVEQQTAEAPEAGGSYAMAYDAARGRLVGFGGYAGRTWEWDGAQWSLHSPASQPASRQYHATTYDAARQRIVLFGGYDSSFSHLDDTWEWDGTDWTELSPANGPSARRNTALAYDAARHRVVLFGGSDGTTNYLGDTWEWDGVDWARVASGGPAARARHAMTWYAARQCVVLFGGEQGYVGEVDDTWEWDGTAWAEVSPLTSPSARSGHAMAYDATRQDIVLFGGQQWPASRETWISDPNGGSITAVVSPFGAGCGAPPLLTSAAVGSRPLIGQSFQSVIDNAPGGLAFMAIGFDNSTFGPFPLPLPLAGFGLETCLLYHSADWVSASPCTSTGATTARHDFPVPNLTALLTVNMYLQAWATSAGYNPAGIITSNALELTFGNT